MVEFTDLKNESEHQLTMWYHKFLEAPYAVDALVSIKKARSFLTLPLVSFNREW
jgi:hypothetical protein